MDTQKNEMMIKLIGKNKKERIFFFFLFIKMWYNIWDKSVWGGRERCSQESMSRRE